MTKPKPLDVRTLRSVANRLAAAARIDSASASAFDGAAEARYKTMAIIQNWWARQLREEARALSPKRPTKARKASKDRLNRPVHPLWRSVPRGPRVCW